MHEYTANQYAIVLRLGGWRQLALGILDSTFLIMPLGNDLLMIAQTVRNRRGMLYYAFMATIGSVLGCLLMDVISRRGGEKTLKKYVNPRRLKYVEAKVRRNAGWALALASLAPPPFPFTPFVIAAAALEYPRRKLLLMIGVSRFIRFAGEGALALLFGRRILHWAESPVVRFGMFLVIVGSIIASVISVYGWIRTSRRAAD
jgi:membrane protein YqaA with SNARE-associated domain